MSSFIAAGTAYATHGITMIPMFLFYSMFGFQRIGDLIWAAADARAKGFLLGGTAGRTTLAGEGLQHQDGHSHLLATTVPNLVAYDPAYAYEIAVIIQDGIRRMFHAQESVFYYVTLGNEPYPMPPMPDGVAEGIVRGIYRFNHREPQNDRPHIQLFGSGAILREVLRAQELLEDRFGIGSDVWSVTSYKELRREALSVDRWNRFHPTESPRESYVEQVLRNVKGPFLAATDYMRLVPEQIAPWAPGRFVTVGTDGFGRSDARPALRRFFEVDAECIVIAALHALAAEDRIDSGIITQAIADFGIDPDKADPVAT